MTRKYVRKMKPVPPYHTQYFESLERVDDSGYDSGPRYVLNYVCQNMPPNALSVWLYLWTLQWGAVITSENISDHFEISKYLYLDAISILQECNLIEFECGEIILKDGSDFVPLSKYI